MKSKITNILDTLDSFEIKNFSINSPANSISMNLSNTEDQVNIEFKEVLSYLFVNDDNIMDTRPMNNGDLNKIAYYQGGVFGLASNYHLDEEDLEANTCYPNFVVDLKDSCLLIEAGAIDIDGEFIYL